MERYWIFANGQLFRCSNWRSFGNVGSPQLHSFTRVQPWVKGVANVRGRLLPLFDLAAFFGDRLTGGRKQRRVLILETETLYSGLMVDQVFGMQHFPMDEYSDQAGAVAENIAPFVTGSYPAGGQQWSLFRPALLAQDPRFINAAKS